MGSRHTWVPPGERHGDCFGHSPNRRATGLTQPLPPHPPGPYHLPQLMVRTPRCLPFQTVKTATPIIGDACTLYEESPGSSHNPLGQLPL